MTLSQVMAVKQQIRKIRHLKKYQPKYKHAHEKAVFKAAAIVKDTKNIVNEIDHQVIKVGHGEEVLVVFVLAYGYFD